MTDPEIKPEYEEPGNLYDSFYQTQQQEQANRGGNKWRKNAFGEKEIPAALQPNGGNGRGGLHTGKFTKEETDTIKAAVEEYCHIKGINIQRLCSECDHKAELKGAWTEIARALPHRSVQSVYRHGLRQLHPYKRGAWTDDECELLTSMVSRHGKKWASIGTRINRSADACRDKYREMNDSYIKGRWKAPEVVKLKTAVCEFLGCKDMEWSDLHKFANTHNIKIAWSVISKKMGNRSRLACFKKWQKLTGTETGSGGGVQQQPANNNDAKMEASGQVDTHTAPTAGAAAAMAAEQANQPDLDVLLLSDLVELNVSRAADVDWDSLRVDNAQERWYELMDEFQSSTSDDSVLAMGLSDTAQLLLDQKTSAQRAAETVEAVDLPSLETAREL